MITEGYLVRHYQGRSGGRGPALIESIDDTLRTRVLIASPFGSPDVPARLDLGWRPLAVPVRTLWEDA